ncbi:hypothetical protein [Pedobacter sp.]|jgi:hypothetical protein|uniref:hypothetical protein n=1 Tax=Pedobacter sp. TaxID=1411316 RepID=UPI002BEB7137|nr:hypothetical protein [Pedobacter sp.]HWW43123.1 hypothetical protein [Pedobacter sp.]
MNQKNFNYNIDQLVFTGFGPNQNMPEEQWNKMVDEIKTKMMSGVESFTAEHKASYGLDDTTTLLGFNKSKNSDFYFFNSFHLHAELNNKEKVFTQKFDLRTFKEIPGQEKPKKNRNITHKESYNLLAGRSICKQFLDEKGGAYDVWMVANFNKVNKHGDLEITKLYPGKSYDFQFEKELSKYPIKDLELDVSRDHLYDSLKRGNQQAVIMVISGEEKLYHIEADARNKTFNVFDDKGKVLSNEQHRELQQVVKNRPYHKSEFETKDLVSEHSKGIDEEGKREKSTLYLDAEGNDKKNNSQRKTMKVQ